MSLSPSIKKRKQHDDANGQAEKIFPAKSPESKPIIIYIHPEGIGPKRLDIMKRSAIKNGFQLSNAMTADVTHIVSELQSKEDVWNSKELKKIRNWNGYIVESQWLVECSKFNSLVSVTGYLLPSLPTSESISVNIPQEETSLYPDPNFDLSKFNECVAERRAVLDHQNKDIAEALDLLREYWSLCHQTVTDERRALAFARAAAAVKCLPFRVTNPRQLKGIKDLGDGHALRVATQIVESGHSQEVEEKRNDKKFLSFQIFCKVFGVGPSIAKKWYAMGLRTAEDVKKRFDQLDVSKDNMISYGVAFYDDLNQPLLLAEAENTYKHITALAQRILPSVVTSMNGGFRRGKSSGHDLDVLFSYPEREHNDHGLIATVRDELDKKGLVVWSRSSRADGPKGAEIDSSPLPAGAAKDHLLQIMIILKYPLDDRFDQLERRDFSTEKNLGPFQLVDSARPWRAIRVDLVGSRTAQYPYAQIGWTGNKQYNRCLRQYAKDALNYSLSSTGLYDKRQHRWLPAQTERDVFDHLKLSYREPWERNF
ncbi:DNA nucleotidylexotransferase-like [Daphnia carinata]|uniref:DNA nucleotidylexotransferase-like n=1 Tax=Daphnia carinata TaxID=120202 RepID=UPI00257B0457|nr:DNA nucleotidylexotransferase-like [Daphnia carinata]